MKIIASHDPVKILQNLRQSLQNKIIRKAVRTAARPIQQEFKQQAPILTGTLRKGFATKMITKKNVVTGIIGVKRGYTKTIGNQLIKPSRYLHLAERKHGFMRASLNRQAQQYFATVAAIIDAEMVAIVKAG